ncbi:hypothetical protein RCG19_23550 [Neobacillus sp. OS1-2]|uniref:hypothetical protein n=1 Tax=Neobacillus sp. OS1-2 TaxID=3070680 RepID=UPI0027E0F1BB|nr:hypothetical protein [Neobacillus sp. OS1-2]WML40085.1 hypothetical protein RCG19_23550 [Neobacillus sp. OS1-2]
MQLNYEQARHLEGKMIQYKNNSGELVVGRVAKVKKEGLEIEEFSSSHSSDGFGFGFWGPRPFFRPPVFVPFVGFGFAPFFFF